MTAAPSDISSARLPLWRAIAGFGVLAILVTLALVAGAIYLENFRLDQYVRGLAADPASASLPDSAFQERILERAAQLDLPVKASDITVVREQGGAEIRIGKYLVETSVIRVALRMRAASFRVSSVTP